MTFNDLCDSCTNIGCEFQSGIVRTKCAFYTPPHIEPDNCGNYVVTQPMVEVIPKADYENRLKADMVAILDKIRAEISDYEEEVFHRPNTDYSDYAAVRHCLKIIDKYKTESEGEECK